VAGFCNPDNNPFKDHKGQWFTRALFLELTQSGSDVKPMFTVKEHDYKGCKSLKKLYMSYEHIPDYEYEFATEVLGGWVHWQRLQKSPIVMEMITQWREELTIKLKAQAMRNIINTTLAEGAVGLQANKYLSDMGYAGSKRGRPSKAEKEQLAKQELAVDREIEGDLERIGLKAINGGKK
jgi:hypothetical protein